MNNKEYYHITDNPLKLMYDAEAISYAKAEVELRKMRLEYANIEEWFNKYGESAGNLKFFQNDARQDEIFERISELEKKLGYK